MRKRQERAVTCATFNHYDFARIQFNNSITTVRKLRIDLPYACTVLLVQKVPEGVEEV